MTANCYTNLHKFCQPRYVLQCMYKEYLCHSICIAAIWQITSYVAIAVVTLCNISKYNN